MTYLIDSNVVMTAARLHYAFDLAPGFWQWIEAQHLAGELQSIPKVKDEITAGHDHLSKWAAALPATFWRPVTAPTITSGQAVARWVSDPALSYRQAARDESLDVADSMLVAEAHASGLIVVSGEIAAPDAVKKVKLPDACRALGVTYANPYDVYRALGLRLIV